MTNTVGIAYATREADEAVTLAADIGKGTWRRGGTPPAELGALDSAMRPIDRLGAAGLGAFTPVLQRHQDVIDRLTGKAAAVRTFADAWQRASKELTEATANLDRRVRTDTAPWAGEAAGAWRVRSAEYVQAMRGTAAAATATAAAATAMGETVAGARTEAARVTAGVVDAIINLARASSAVQGNPTELLARVERLATTSLPQVSKAEGDLLATIGNFRATSPGGLQDLWKRLGVWFGALPRDMAQVTPPTDAQRGDLGRGGAYLDGSRIHLVPRNPTVPRVTLPNDVGAEGFEVGPRWNIVSPEHTYNVRTETTIPFDRARDLFGEAIAQDPVPASGDLHARPEGVTNDAGLGNLVRTYTYPSPDPSRFSDITVNYTLGDKHILQEGYVIRYGERMPDGNTRIVSYGEGNGLLQHPVSPAHILFGLGWKDNHADIEATVDHRMNMPPR
jgi:hypothetical protein